LRNNYSRFTDLSSSSRLVCSSSAFIGYNVAMQMTDALGYSEEHVLEYPVEYLAGIDLYNSGEFHAAHDAWEERWMGPVDPQEKLFLQAMIQSAVAFHHLQIGRPGAARRMYLAAKEKFGKLGADVFMSLDLIDYQEQLDQALSWLLSVPDPREIEQPEIRPPVIRLATTIVTQR
jgi:predicted metal-dependent hydrolase